MVLASLLNSCQGAKTAFPFRQPTSTVALPDSSSIITSGNQADTHDYQSTAVASVAAVTPLLPPAQSVVNTRINRNDILPQQPAPASKRLKARQASAEPESAGDRHKTFHILLGTGLVVASVVAGILLGGWLGLGVGAVGVILGYYFLVLGIGGPQAWLGVFQEFFNM